MTTQRTCFLAIFLFAAALPLSASHGENAVPLYRTLPPPRVLYLGETATSQEVAELLQAKAPARVTFGQLSYNLFDIHHLGDKPLEESQQDIDFMTREGKVHLEHLLADLKRYDVIVTQFPGTSPDPATQATILDAQKRIVQYVHEGGRLVIIDGPQSGPIAEIMPCKPTANSTWTTDCQGATDHPFSRGLPFEVTGASSYTTLFEAADQSSIPLTRNASNRNRFWVRPVAGGGQVVYLYTFYRQTPLWEYGNNYKSYDAERPDDGAVWDVFLPRLFYGLVYGDRAFPVLAKIGLAAGTTCRQGDKLTVPVDVENRWSSDGSGFRGTIALEVSDRRTPRKIAATRAISLQKGERQIFSFDNTIDLPGADNYLLVRARVLDETGKLCLSESTAWIPYIHQVPLTVETTKPSYRPGDAITAIIKHGTNALPAEASLRLYLVDHEGRALQSCDGTKSLIMPDGGPKLLSTYWVTAVVSSKDRILGTARTQVQLDEPWNMRKQLQWSVWTGTGDPHTLALFRDAGFNALGYPGNSPAADRFAMHQYVEGADINTFGVLIDHDNWKDVRAAMEQVVESAEKGGGPDARSKSLVSLGEESGFHSGWGQRYYWDGDKAPAIPQKVFDGYLSELYTGDIAALNVEWGTNYKSFVDIPLEKAKVRAPEGVFVNAQAWVAGQTNKFTETYPVDMKKIDPKEKYLAKTASFYETYAFFDWYYQKYCDAAMETYRARRNPVPLSIMSAPGGLYPKVDVANFAFQGPFYPKECSLAGNAIARRDYGDVPGFGLMWAYFDLYPLWSCNILSCLLVGNNHLDYWVDFPLTFNPDLTHTRASFWTKALTRQLKPIEPILLHRRIAYTHGLGMFVPRRPIARGILGQHFGSSITGDADVYSALEESGYLPKVVNTCDLDGINVLFASYAQVVSPQEGKEIAAFVKNGGTLIATPWLASCSAHGNLLSVYPAAETGLADLLGFKLLNTSQTLAAEDVMFKNLKLTSKGHDKLLDLAPDVEVTGKHADGEPLVLSRKVGRGRVVYLNFIYDWNGWWNSFYEPARETYRQLIDGFIHADGRVSSEYYVAFESAQAVEDNKGWSGMAALPVPPQPVGSANPWWGTQLFSDPSGQIKYLAIFSDHRSPKITAQIQWARKDFAIFDLFKGEKVNSKDGRASLTLGPGEATIWAITPRAPKSVRLEMPTRVVAGQPIKIKIASPNAAGFVLDVSDPSGHLSRSHSLANVQLLNGRAVVEIPTAENDPVGEYRVVATESMTRLCTERRFTLTRSTMCASLDVLTPFPRRTSDDWPTATMSSEEFIEHLRLLRSIYLGTFNGLEAKYMLSYFLDVPFRDNRHAIMHRLQRVEWGPHLDALADAMRSGETFYLLGEDLNIDPQTGLSIDPYAACDPAVFLNQLAKLPGAKRQTQTLGGLKLDVITLGKGAMIVSPQSSVDRVAYHSTDFIAWHERTKAVLADVKQ